MIIMINDVNNININDIRGLEREAEGAWVPRQEPADPRGGQQGGDAEDLGEKVCSGTFGDIKVG